MFLCTFILSCMLHVGNLPDAKLSNVYAGQPHLQRLAQIPEQQIIVVGGIHNKLHNTIKVEVTR